MNNIVFLFPGLDLCPTGGFKMCYEYANRFAQEGFEVTVIYPEFCGEPRKNTALFWIFKYMKHKVFFIKNKISHKETLVPDWFNLDSRVKKEYVWKFSNSKTLKYQNAKFIATALATSFEIAKAIKSPVQNRYYFVQGFESWGTQSPEKVYNSYKLPLKKITIAPWLVKRIESTGDSACLVENGLDFEYFKMTVPIEKRTPYEVAMLYHTSEIKRSIDAIEALKKVKQIIPELHVTMFGVPERPDVPDWFSYYRTPDKETHNKIYNTASIFVAPSRLEGMGLTPAESMMCGCAVACTDNPGFDIFSRNNETTLVSPVCDVNALAKNILKLIQDNEFRIKLAKSGHEFIQQFTWKRAYSKFKTALEL